MVMKRLKRKAGKGVNVFFSKVWGHDVCQQTMGREKGRAGASQRMKSAYTTSTTSSCPSVDTVKRTSLSINGMPYTFWGLS